MNSFYEYTKKQKNTEPSSKEMSFSDYTKVRKTDINSIVNNFKNTDIKEIESIVKKISSGEWQDAETMNEATDKINRYVNNYVALESMGYFNNLPEEERKGYGELLKGLKSDVENKNFLYTNFKNIYEYNSFIMNNTADREGGMSAPNIAARIKAYESNKDQIKVIDEEITNMSEDEKWIEEPNPFSGSQMVISTRKKPSEKHQKLLDEKAYLEEQIRLYERYDQKRDERMAVDTMSEDYAQFDYIEYLHQAASERGKKVGNIEKTIVDIETQETNGNIKSPKKDNSNNSVYDPYKAQGEFLEKAISNGMYIDPLTQYLIYRETLEGKYAPPPAIGTAAADGLEGKWEYLTEEEKKYYYYLTSKGKHTQALDFLEVLRNVLYRREESAKAENAKELSGWELGIDNITSIPLNIIGGAMGFIDDLDAWSKNAEIDPYSLGHQVQTEAQITRGEIGRRIDEATGDTEFLEISLGDVYRAAMSGIDSAVGTLVFREYYSVIAGMGAASSKAKQLYEQGASEGQIAAASMFAGVAEMVFEKVSIDHFLGEFVNAPANKWSKLLLQTAAQGGIEMSEEMATELANTITDTLVLGSRSEWEKLISSYKQKGYSDTDAVINAMWDKGGDILKEGIMGFISGGMMGGGGSIVNYASNKTINAHNTTLNYGASQESISALIKNGLAMPEGSVAYSQAVKAQAKVKSGKKVSGTALYNLATAVKSEIKTKSQARLVELGVSRSDIKTLAPIVAKAVFGENLTLEEQSVINNSEAARQVVKELSADPVNTIWKDAITNSSSSVVDSDSILNYNENSINKGEINNGEDTELLERGEVSTAYRGNDVLRKPGTNSKMLATCLGISQGSDETNIRTVWAGECDWLDGKSNVANEKTRQGFNNGIFRRIQGIKLSGKDTIGGRVSTDILERFKNTICKDENGNLISLYHWTTEIFEEFSKGEFGFHFGTLKAAHDRYLQTKEEKADISKGIYKEVILNITNPIELIDENGKWTAGWVAIHLLQKGIIDEQKYDSLSKLLGFDDSTYNNPAAIAVREILAQNGYDGIIYENLSEDAGSYSFIALYPEQIITVAENGVLKENSGISRAILGNEVASFLSHNKNSTLINEDEFTQKLYGENGTPKSNFKDFKENNVSKKDYDKFFFKKPIKVSKKDWARVNSVRTKKYLKYAEDDIPDVDFLRIAEYNQINVAYRYYIRNYDRYSFEIVSKIKIKEEYSDVRTTNANANRNRMRRGIDIGGSRFVEYRTGISSNDSMVEWSREPNKGRITNNGNSDSGRRINNNNITKATLENRVAFFDDIFLKKSTNAVTKTLSSYAPAKRGMIIDFLISVDERLKAFVERVKNGSNIFERFTISNVSGRESEDIKNILGIDIAGYTHNINTSGIRHILKRHGISGNHDHTMSNDNDIARMGWVINNYDNVEVLFENGEVATSGEFKDMLNRPASQIRYSKKINGTYYVVEAVFENDYNKLWVQSAYLKNNKEGVTQDPAESQKDQPHDHARSALASPPSFEVVTQVPDAAKRPLMVTSKTPSASPTSKGSISYNLNTVNRGPSSNTDILYGFKKENKGSKDISFLLNRKITESMIVDNVIKVVKMDSVSDLTGKEFEKGSIDLITQVENFFDSIDNIAKSKYGDVHLTRVGIKSSIGHGIGRQKAAAFKAVPNVIKYGEVINYQENWKNRGYDTAVFAAPITINNEKYFLAAVVNVEANRNIYYLHEVALQKAESNALFKTGTVKNGTPSNALPSIYTLLRKLQIVNSDYLSNIAEFDNVAKISFNNNQIDSPIMTDTQLNVDTLSEPVSKDIISNKINVDNNDRLSKTDNIEYEALNEKEQGYIKKICNKFGIDIVFEDLREMVHKGEILSPDGYIEKDKGIIHLNLYAENPIGFVLKHELTHFGEKSSRYIEFVKAVKKSKLYKKWISEKTGESDVKIAEYKYKQAVASAHSDIYGTADPKAEAEMIADFVGDMLFTENGSGMEALTSDKVARNDNLSRDYSYESLVSKRDMRINFLVKATEKEMSSYKADRNLFAKNMIKNAAKVGNVNNADTKTFLHCNDLNKDILITRNSFKHGAARMDETYVSVCKSIADIIENSIVVNEFKERSQTNGSYVLLGLAENENNYVVVRSVVDKKTWRLENYEELYAIRKKSIKKEDVGVKAPALPSKTGYGTSSTISIVDFLRFVNSLKMANSVLPFDVVKKLNSDRTYDDSITPSLLYSQRDPSFISDRDTSKPINSWEKQEIEKICNKFGIGIVFEDLREMVYKGEILSPDGYIEKDKGIIHLNLYAENPIGFVLKHELTHFGEKSDKYFAILKHLGYNDSEINSFRKKVGMIYENQPRNGNINSQSDISRVQRVRNNVRGIDKSGSYQKINIDKMGDRERTRWFYGGTDSRVAIPTETGKDSGGLLGTGVHSTISTQEESRSPKGLDNTVEKDKKATSGEEVAFSMPGKYSYEALINKPDVKITLTDSFDVGIDGNTRKGIIDKAIENAVKIGSENENGNAVVYIKDIDSEIILSKSGLRHGLDRRFELLAPIILKSGEILSNSIRINDLVPRADNISKAYVLIGVAKNAKNELYIVSFVVNKVTSEVSDIDVLYAINAKTEPAGSLSPSVPVLKTDYFTGSTISISKLLDYVNRYFPDVLPESVLRHYGYDGRPEGKIGESALFSMPIGKRKKATELSDNKSYHIYDITNKIRDTAHRVNDVGRPVGDALKNGISNDSITKNTDVVNNNYLTKTDNIEYEALNEKEQGYIKKICNKFGIGIVFEDLREMVYKGEILSPDGYIEKDKGIIHLNLYAENPIGFVLKHELTHFGEKSSRYVEFVNAVKKSATYKKWISEKTSESDVRIAEYKYKQMVASAHSDIYGTADPKAEAEMIADFAGEMLFTENGSGMAALTSDLDTKQRNAIVQFVLDFISYVKKKLSGIDTITFELSRLEDKFIRMMADSVQEYAAIETENLNYGEQDIAFCYVRCEDEDLISQAEELEKEGLNGVEIFNQIGVYKNVFGEWAESIDLGRYRFYPYGNHSTGYNLIKKSNHIEGRLRDIVIWPELYEKFPEFEDVKIVIKPSDFAYDKTKFIPDENGGKIIINQKLCDDYATGEDYIAKEEMVKAIQHMIQFKEGNYVGRSYDYWKDLEAKGKLPYLEKKGRYITADEMMHKFADNYDADMAARRQFVKYVKTNLDKQPDKYKQAALYQPYIDENDVIVYGGRNKLMTLYEKNNVKKRRLPNNYILNKNESDYEIFTVDEKGEATQKVKDFVWSKEKRPTAEFRQNWGKIKGGNSGFLKSFANGFEKRFLNQKYIISNTMVSDEDTVGRKLSLWVQEKIDDSLAINEKGQPISGYVVSLHGDDVFRQAGLGLPLSTIDAAIARYNDTGSVSGKNTNCFEFYMIIKRPFILYGDPQELSLKEIGLHLVESGYLSEKEYLKMINSEYGKKPSNYNAYMTRKLRNILINEGFDSLIYENQRYDKGSITIAVFDKSQLIPVAKDGLLIENNGIEDARYKDYWFDEDPRFDGAKENKEKLAMYVQEPQYNLRTVRKQVDSRIKLGDAGFFEKLQSSAQEAYEYVCSELSKCGEIELSGYDNAGRRFTYKAFNMFRNCIFRDENGDIMIFVLWNTKPKNISQAAKMGIEFGTVDFAFKRFFDHKESKGTCYNGVFEEFILNCSSPLVLPFDGWNAATVAQYALEHGIINDKFYNRLLSLKSIGSSTYISDASQILREQIKMSGYDCIIFTKSTGEKAVVPLYDDLIIPISENGILKPECDIYENIISKTNDDVDGEVIKPKKVTVRDFSKVKDIILAEEDSTKKLKHLTEFLSHASNSILTENNDINVGFSGAFDTIGQNLWKFVSICNNLLSDAARNIAINERDTADRFVIEEIRQELRDTKLKNENGRLLSFFFFDKYRGNGFKHSSWGYHVTTLKGAHDMYLAERQKHPKLTQGEYVECFVNSKNPYILQNAPKEFTAKRLAEELYKNGVLSGNEYRAVREIINSNKVDCLSGATRCLNSIMAKKGYDSIIYMCQDTGNTGVIVFNESQLIPVSVNGNAIEYNDLETADPNGSAFLLKFVEKLYNKNIENLDEYDIIKLAREYLKSPEGQKDKRPYLRHRPAYVKNQIEIVYENAKSVFGKVYDPSGIEITWDPSKPRNGQWDMGHIPGQRYAVVHAKYVLGMMTPSEFLQWYRDPNNYRPELPSTNRGHNYE